MDVASWYDSCYRKLFLDYHTQRSAVEVGRNFNGAKWAESLAAAGVEGVSCIAKCAYGWRYYRKGAVGYIHPHLPEGMDILEDTVRECHARGIRVIAYYHTFGSEPVCEAHPEWRVRNADGSASGLAVCMLGPALEKEMLPQLNEIAGNYDVDGVFLDGTYYAGQVCYCEACRARYRAETGLELPGNDRDEHMDDYVRWAEEAYRRVRERAYEVIRAANPNALPSVNWAYTTRQPEDAPEGAGFLSQDISPSDMAASISMQARNWALTGRPFDVMNHMALKWWQEWSVKPLTSLLQESALVLANGGKTWVGYQMYPTFGVAPYLLETLRMNFEFVRRLEPLLKGAKPIPYVCVLHGAAQTDARRTAPNSAFVDEMSLRGVHRMLTLSGIPYHSAGEKDLMRNLPRFKAVIAANDQPMSNELVAALTRYVSEGGNLLVTGKAGMVDGSGAFCKNPALEGLLGVEVSEGYPHRHGYLQLTERGTLTAKVADMPLLSTRPFTLVKPTAARTLADLRAIYLRSDGQPLFTEYASNTTTFSPPGELTGTAALTIRDFGRGRAAYCATDLFAGYAGNSNWSLKNLVKNLLNDLLIGKDALRIEAPGYVEVALSEREG